MAGCINHKPVQETGVTLCPQTKSRHLAGELLNFTSHLVYYEQELLYGTLVISWHFSASVLLPSPLPDDFWNVNTTLQKPVLNQSRSTMHDKPTQIGGGRVKYRTFHLERTSDVFTNVAADGGQCLWSAFRLTKLPIFAALKPQLKGNVCILPKVSNIGTWAACVAMQSHQCIFIQELSVSRMQEPVPFLAPPNKLALRKTHTFIVVLTEYSYTTDSRQYTTRSKRPQDWFS